MSKTVSITGYTDWKDVDGLIESFEKSLKEFGIKLVENPDTEDSDCFSFILIGDEAEYEDVKNEVRDSLMIEGEDKLDEDGEERLEWIMNELNY